MERRVLGYIRVGPRETPRTRLGPDAQRREIERGCAERSWKLVGFEQDVRSGRTLRRPGLERALAACRAGSADAIVTARLDRLTYSLPDLVQLTREAVADGFALVALDVGLDLGAESGRVVHRVLEEAASWRPRFLTRGVRSVSAARPGRPSSTPPEVAERIRRLRERGETLQAICDVLNAEGVPTPRGGSHWRPTSLRAIVRPTRGGNA